MSAEALVEPMLRLSLFQGLATSQLRAIAAAVERVMFDTGKPIITQDAAGDCAFILVKGRADRIGSAGQPSEPVPVGALIGEMAMLVETTYATTVIAMEPVRALRIGREALRTVMMMDPDIAAHFVAKLTSRMRQLTADLREVEENLAPRPPLELGETARPLLS